MKKVFLILLITFSFADLKIKTENNELIKEIAQKDAMEDINLFKYRESYYVPEERILNFNKNYSQEYYQLYEYIYLKSVDNYYNSGFNFYDVFLPNALSITIFSLIIYYISKKVTTPTFFIASGY